MVADDRRRPLGFPALLALGVNGIVGVGIFFAPASVASEVPGSAGAWVYAATGLLLLPIALGYAALGKRFDVDGGPYVWAHAAFGPRAAFSVGWMSYVSSLFSMAAVVSGLSHHAAPLIGITTESGQRGAAAAFIVVLGAVAASGLRPSSVVWSTVTILKLVPLLLLVLAGLFLFQKVAPPAAIPGAHRVGWHGVERAVLVVVFASQGFEIVPVLAGSVRRSARAIPWATVGSLTFAVALYSVLHWVSVRAVPGLGQSATPLVAAGDAYGGPALAALVGAGANISAFGIAFGMMNTTPRYLAALSDARSFGSWIGHVDAREVPQRALWITVAVALVFCAGARALTELLVLSSLAVLIQYSAVLASLTVLSVRRAHGLHPKNLWPVPLSVAGVLFAAQGAERIEIAIAGGVIVAGETLRFFVVSRRESLH